MMQSSDITGSWDILKPSIAESLPPAMAVNDSVFNNILQELVEGRMQSWAYYENDKIVATVTTKPIGDTASGTKNLLIYSVKGFERLQEDQWTIALTTLKNFAASRDCSYVVGYTRLEYIKDKVVNDLSGEFEYFVSMEVE
jgi:hypothetical protein